MEETYTGENEKWLQINKRIVIRRESDGEPYLIRRTLLSIGKYFSIKYHQILQSDDLCAHDHPWNFLTIILKGGYYEWTPVMQFEKGKVVSNRIGVNGKRLEVKRWHGAGSILYRPASWIHTLELKIDELYHVRENDGNMTITALPPKTRVAHTLVFTGKVFRDWGFITKHGWIFWRNYTKEKYCS